MNKFKIIEKENLKFQLNNIQSINNETYFIELDFHGEYVIINDLVEMPLFKSNQKTILFKDTNDENFIKTLINNLGTVVIKNNDGNIIFNNNWLFGFEPLKNKYFKNINPFKILLNKILNHHWTNIEEFTCIQGYKSVYIKLNNIFINIEVQYPD